MTAREFARRYVEEFNIDETRLYHMLDNYLSTIATVKYSQFPDAELPDEFIEDGDQPARFEEYLNL